MSARRSRRHSRHRRPPQWPAPVVCESACPAGERSCEPSFCFHTTKLCGAEQSHLLCHALKRFEGAIELRARMLAGHDQSNASLAFRHRWKSDSRSHHAFVEERAAHLHGGAALAKNDGCNRSLGGGSVHAANVEACAPKLILKVACISPQPVDAIGLALKNVEGCDARCCDSRRMRCGEEEGPRAVVEIVDEIPRAPDVANGRADGL